MISKHSAHLTPLPFGIRTWLWRYTCLLLLISMFWHRQAIFKSKGDKLCSSAECRIWTRGLRHQIASRLNDRWQTDWAIEDQAKNLNSTARPYDQRAFITLDPTVSWLSQLCFGTGMRFSNRKETSCVPLLNAGFQPRGSLKPNVVCISVSLGLPYMASIFPYFPDMVSVCPYFLIW